MSPSSMKRDLDTTASWAQILNLPSPSPPDPRTKKDIPTASNDLTTYILSRTGSDRAGPSHKRLLGRPRKGHKPQPTKSEIGREGTTNRNHTDAPQPMSVERKISAVGKKAVERQLNRPPAAVGREDLPIRLPRLRQVIRAHQWAHRLVGAKDRPYRAMSAIFRSMRPRAEWRSRPLCCGPP